MEDENQSNDNMNYLIDIGLKCVFGGIVIIFYSVGVHLHIKLIKTSKNDKNMTWMMDIANSILILCNFAHFIIMYIITYMIDNLYIYTGSWFCYTSKALSIMGNAHVGGHTFFIAIMKYVMIVLHDKVRSFGKENAQRIFLAMNVLYPIYIFLVFHLINPDFLFIYGHVSQSLRCLGESEIYSAQNPNQTVAKLHNFCEFSESFEPWSVMKVIRLGRSIFCWIHVGLIYLLFWNVIEAFLYFFVFKFMWR